MNTYRDGNTTRAERMREIETAAAERAERHRIEEEQRLARQNEEAAAWRERRDARNRAVRERRESEERARFERELWTRYAAAGGDREQFEEDLPKLKREYQQDAALGKVEPATPANDYTDPARWGLR